MTSAAETLDTPTEDTIPSPWEAITEAVLLDAAAAAGHELDAQQREAVAALAAPHERGVYLHGSVGRGKSWLADRVLEAVEAPKARLHIHTFLKRLQERTAVEGMPLLDAVRDLVGDARFLLLDEFHVHDIADAIMLRRTLVTLLESDVALLMTSNYPPQRLLPDPTFHEAVRPAIDAIEASLETVHLSGEHDYREDSAHAGGFASGTWAVYPPAPVTPGVWTPKPVPDVVPVALSATRTLAALSVEDGTLRVTWAELCDGSVSVGDYLTLAARFDAFELIGVPRPQIMGPEAFQRLAYLLDVLVDADKPLHVTAATPKADITKAPRLPRDADRMLSRLNLLAERRAGETDAAQA